jgi:hypothetical protein
MPLGPGSITSKTHHVVRRLPCECQRRTARLRYVHGVALLGQSALDERAHSRIVFHEQNAHLRTF